MRAGEMDRRIVIEQNTPTRSSSGAEKAAWTTLATVWAKVMEQRGREFFGSQTVVGEAKAVFRIRHRSDVTRAMRISYNGEIWDIHSIDELPRRTGLDILATARAA